MMRTHGYALALGVLGLLTVAGAGLAHAQACFAAGGAVYVFDILAARPNSPFLSMAGARIDSVGVRSFDGTVVILTDQQGNPVVEIGMNEQLGQVSNSPHPFATTLVVLSQTGTAFLRTEHGGNAPPQQSQGQVTACPQSSS
jgi:hypothetical protein